MNKRNVRLDNVQLDNVQLDSLQLDRVELALRAAYREQTPAHRQADEPVETQRHVMRIMARVRGAARARPEGATGDARFLWRFVSAGAVAAAALLVVAFTDLSQESASAANLAVDDVVVTVMNPTLPF